MKVEIRAEGESFCEIWIAYALLRFGKVEVKKVGNCGVGFSTLLQPYQQRCWAILKVSREDDWTSQLKVY